MSGKSDEIEITCPECKRVVKVSVSEAERKMKVTCPNGHEIPIVKAL
jgi:phage FluMu protein Com